MAVEEDSDEDSGDQDYPRNNEEGHVRSLSDVVTRYEQYGASCCPMDPAGCMFLPSCQVGCVGEAQA